MNKKAVGIFGRRGPRPPFPPSPSMLQEALACLNAGRLLDAEGKAHAILAAHPNDPRALNILGCVALRRGLANEALKVFERAKALQPRDALIHFHLGETYFALQSYADAARHYKKATKLNQNFAEAHAQLGEALRAMGRWAEAANEYQNALKKRPDLPNCWQGLGLLSVRSGDFAEAAKHFEAGIKFVLPTDGEGRASLWSNVGRARLQAGRSIGGIEALTEAVRCAPANRDYSRLLAESLLNIRAVPTGTDFRDALLALFERDDINRSVLATAAIALLKSNFTVADLLAKVGRQPEYVDELIEREFESLSCLVHDQLFLSLFIVLDAIG